MAARTMQIPLRASRNCPGTRHLRHQATKGKGSGGGVDAVLGAPGGTGAAHIMQFGPIGPDGVAGKFTPETSEYIAEDGEGPRYQSDRGTRDGQNGSTHDNSSHIDRLADRLVRTSL